MTFNDLFALVPVIGFVLYVAQFVYLLSGLTKDTARRLLLAIAVYVVHGAMGIATLIYYRPVLSSAPAAPYGAVTALFGWFGLGLRILFRIIPNAGERPKPQWMMHFGLLDVVCLLAIAGGAGIAIGII